MVKAHPALIWSGRTVVGIVGVAVAGAVVLGIGRVPLPSVSAEPANMVVAPDPAEQVRSCAGSLLAPSTTNASGSGLGDPSITIAANGKTTNTTLEAPDNSGGTGRPVAVALPASGDRAPSLSVATGQTVSSPQLSGFATAGCASPAADSWLVGGSTMTGRTTFIVLTNPGRAVANVDISIYADAGVVDAPGATGIIVEPGQQRVLSMASLAPGLAQPIVHVASRGGSVSAVLQQSIVEGLDPHGVDYVEASAAPSTAQTITGFVVPEAAPVGHDHDYDDGVPVVRLIAPGTNPVDVVARFIPEEGSAEPLPIEFSIPGNQVQELVLDNVPAGTYTVVLDSSAALVAGGRVTATSGTDFAWFASTAAIGGDGSLAIAAGDSPVLHLTNLTDTDANVRLTASEGDPISVFIPAGGAASTPVVQKRSYTTEGITDVSASVSYGGSSVFSSYAVTPINPSARPVTVYPR